MQLADTPDKLSAKKRHVSSVKSGITPPVKKSALEPELFNVDSVTSCLWILDIETYIPDFERYRLLHFLKKLKEKSVIMLRGPKATKLLKTEVTSVDSFIKSFSTQNVVHDSIITAIEELKETISNFQKGTLVQWLEKECQNFEKSPPPIDFQNGLITNISVVECNFNHNSLIVSRKLVFVASKDFAPNCFDASVSMFYSNCEESMIQQFSECLKNANVYCIVGHYLNTFDWKFISQKLPKIFTLDYVPTTDQIPPFFNNILEQDPITKLFLLDTSIVSSGYYQCKGNSLDNLAKKLLVLSEDETKTLKFKNDLEKVSTIQQLWVSSQQTRCELAKYCMRESELCFKLLEYFWNADIQRLVKLEGLKVIKCALDQLVPNEDSKENIETVVLRTNVIVTRAYQLMKFFFQDAFSLLDTVSLSNADKSTKELAKQLTTLFTSFKSQGELTLFARDALWVVSYFQTNKANENWDVLDENTKLAVIKRGKSNAATNKKRLLLANVYMNYMYDCLDPTDESPVNDDNLSRILDHEAIQIATSYMNNMQMHFLDHFNRFLNVFLKKDYYSLHPSCHPALKRDLASKNILVDFKTEVFALVDEIGKCQELKAIIQVVVKMINLLLKVLQFEPKNPDLKEKEEAAELKDAKEFEHLDVKKWKAIKSDLEKASFLNMSTKQREEFKKNHNLNRDETSFFYMLSNLTERISIKKVAKFAERLLNVAKHSCKHKLIRRWNIMKSQLFSTGKLEINFYPEKEVHDLWKTLQPLLATVSTKGILYDLKVNWFPFLRISAKMNHEIEKLRNQMLFSKSFCERMLFGIRSSLCVIEQKLPMYYNVYPQRTTLIPQHIRLETRSFLQLCGTASPTEGITFEQKQRLWSEHINFNHDVFTKNNKNYKFDGSIVSDGYSVSVQMKRVDLDFCDATSHWKREEKYIHELSSTELKELRSKEIAEIDPNEYDMIYLVTKKVENASPHFVPKPTVNELTGKKKSRRERKIAQQEYQEKYSTLNKQKQLEEQGGVNEISQARLERDKWSRLTYSAGRRRRELRQDWIKRVEFNFLQANNQIKVGANENGDIIQSINELTNELSTHDHKTLDIQKFQRYIRAKLRYNNLLKAIYNNKIWRRHRFYQYQNTQRSEAELINRIKGITQKKLNDVVIGFGDWEQSRNRKGKAPTKGKGLRTLLRRNGFNVFLVDEYRTSKQCAACLKKGIQSFNKSDIDVADPNKLRKTKRELKTLENKIRTMKKYNGHENSFSKEYIADLREKVRLKVEQLKGLKESTEKVSCHGLTHCQNSECSIYWNRDFNSALNMYEIVRSHVYENCRPKLLCRNMK
ncbi:hypothetical protein RCL1_000695 [Eukaryota sp. TZLM3-RCL]